MEPCARCLFGGSKHPVVRWHWWIWYGTLDLPFSVYWFVLTELEELGTRIPSRVRGTRCANRELGLRYGATFLFASFLFWLVGSVERALGHLIAYAYAVFSLGHVVMLELDYWQNCGSLGRKGKGIVVLVHCSFSYLIVSLCYWYVHMQCWALLVRAFLLCCPADQGAGLSS